MTGHRTGQGIVLAVLLMLVTAGLGDGAAADTHRGGSGLVGRHSLRDSPSRAGAVCRYSVPAAVFDTLTVRAPRVLARDISTGRDHQRVDWSLRVQYWDINGYWADASTAGPWRATAWDDTPAAFTAQTVAAPIGAGGIYRVLVRMRWRRAGAVEGTSTHLVDYYRRVMGPGSVLSGPQGDCPEQLVP